MGVNHLRIQPPERPLNPQNEVRRKSFSLIEADNGYPESLDLGNEQSGPLETENTHLVPEPLPLADQVEHDPLQSPAVE